MNDRKKLGLKHLKVASFVTGLEKNPKGGTLINKGDGTINICHCPTYACNPSIEWPTQCCL